MFTNRSQFSLFSLKALFIFRPSIIKPLKIKGEIVVHKNSLSHNRKCSTVNKCIILFHAAMFGMAFLILPLRQGESPEGARGTTYQTLPLRQGERPEGARGTTYQTLPLRQGESPAGARGYDLILPRPTATPSILEGEVCISK